jgi:hypothetical protein
MDSSGREEINYDAPQQTSFKDTMSQELLHIKYTHSPASFTKSPRKT